jgi:hypothetical protein
MVSESEKTSAFLIPLKTGRLPEICERRSASLFAWESLTMQSSFRIHPTLPASGNPEKITVKELADKWVELKRMEISTNTMSRYESIIKNMLPAWGKTCISGNNRRFAVHPERSTDWLPGHEEGISHTG